MDVADFTFTPSCETFHDLIEEPEDIYPDDKTIVCSNRVKDINFSDVIWPKKRYNGDLYEYYGNVVAHLDTGAKVTVTNLQYILHDYKPYKKLLDVESGQEFQDGVRLGSSQMHGKESF